MFTKLHNRHIPNVGVGVSFVDFQLYATSIAATGIDVPYSWNPTGPTRTPTLSLSCNFVNVYMIVYHVHVQYTYACTRAHLKQTTSRGIACVSDKSPRTSWRGSSCVSGSWRAERAARAAAVGMPRAQWQAEDPLAEVGEEVRVGVGVRVGRVEFKLMGSHSGTCHSAEV